MKTQDRLRRLNAGTCRILANGDLSAPPGKSKFRDERYQGLLAELNLAVGAKVMLRYNLSVARGLVNGSFGTVVGILYDEAQRPARIRNTEFYRVPDAVLVKFEGYTGPSCSKTPGVVPILPLKRYCRKDDAGDEAFREQVPLNLAWAISAHKAQGLTIETEVAVDLGKRELDAGVTFVQLSRVRDVRQLYVDCEHPFSYDLDRWLEIGRRNAKTFAVRNAYLASLQSAHANTMRWLQRTHPTGVALAAEAAKDPTT